MISPKISAMIIDDEPMAISSLARMLQKHCPKVDVVATTQNPVEGLKEIKELQPDLLFLDIAMPRMDGFSLLRNIPDLDIKVIFITAYDEYAIQAFKEEAVDYLLKPIDKEELINAVKKVEQSLKIHFTEERLLSLFDRFQKMYSPVQSIGLPTMEGLNFVKVEQISHCKSDGNYTEVFLNDGQKVVISRQLQFLKDKLNPQQFIRVHRSYLVNLNYIKKYLRGRGGSLIMQNGEVIPVSSRRKNDLMDSLDG